jgi:N-acetylmuramoyl-L-alanine amidase
MAFQYKHGFARSGVVESRTLKALRLRAGWPAAWPAGPVSRGTGYASPDGSIRVRQVQRALGALGYPAGPIDGVFGPRTEAATLRFQRSHGLPPDGIVERHTLRALLTRPPAAATPGGATPVSRAPRAQVKHTPHLPTIPILIGLAVLGLIVGVASYVITGRRLQPRQPDPGGYFPDWKEEP